MPVKRKILATNALPYANGVPHLGHLVGTIQGDIWVRLKKMLGYDCLYICGSDSHGTPHYDTSRKNGAVARAAYRPGTSRTRTRFRRFSR